MRVESIAAPTFIDQSLHLAPHLQVTLRGVTDVRCGTHTKREREGKKD
jgi:hypothetical protein